MSEPVWSVSDVNEAVRDLMENSFLPFWLTGEIGTLTSHRSGHVYLTLKDQNAQIKTAWFGGAKKAEELGLKIGCKIEAMGKLSAYPARGEYQFNIKTVRLAGQGNLLLEFEQIKKKLESEGLFAPERKRKIPDFPAKVGVITAREGAAVKDFIKITLENFPSAQISICPAAMQGENCVKEVCRALDFLNRQTDIDAIVITRGGGSMEDLWPFNHEIMARKIAASRIPVISAVGHEIDFTICDFVADLRSPTPTAAAEQLFGKYAELYMHLARTERDLKNIVKYTWDSYSARAKNACGHYVLREPRHLIELRQQQLDEIDRRNIDALNRKILGFSSKLDMAERELSALGPQNVLKRGFAIIQDKNGEIIASTKKILLNQTLRITLADGVVESEVNNIIRK